MVDTLTCLETPNLMFCSKIFVPVLFLILIPSLLERKTNFIFLLFLKFSWKGLLLTFYILYYRLFLLFFILLYDMFIFSLFNSFYILFLCITSFPYIFSRFICILYCVCKHIIFTFFSYPSLFKNASNIFFNSDVIILFFNVNSFLRKCS